MTMKFIEKSSEYANDIDLFTQFWNNLENLSVIEVIKALREKLKEVETFNIKYDRQYSIENFWEEAKIAVFYEDVKFVLTCLEKLKDENKISIIQCPDFPNKVIREKHLVELIYQKHSFLKH